MAKMSPMRMSALLQAVRDGNYFRTAAAASGVHFTTAYDWIKRGDELIAAERVGDPDIEASLADWIGRFDTAVDADSEIWRAAPPPPFFMPDWHYVLFSMLMRRAQAQAEADSVSLIRKSAKEGNWLAAAWYLERTRPELFGRKQQVSHAGFDGGPVTVEGTVTPVSDDELLRRIQELKAKRDGI